MQWFSHMRDKWYVRQAALRIHDSPWRTALEDLPPQVANAWRATAPQEYGGIPTDPLFFACAAEGLMQFFDAAVHSDAPCTLPSEAANSVWHAWLRHDSTGLEHFCRKHFGMTIPHAPRGELAAGALLNTLLSCVRRSEDARQRRLSSLPHVFALDAGLGMPGGHGYWLHDGEIFHAPIDPRGRCVERARPHPELTPCALYDAGLLDRETVLAIQRHGRRRQHDKRSGNESDWDWDWFPTGNKGSTMRDLPDDTRGWHDATVTDSSIDSFSGSFSDSHGDSSGWSWSIGDD